MRWLSKRFELSRSDGSGNVRPMEGLRGFAVFLVFLVHYVTLSAAWIPRHSRLETIAMAVHTIGNAGVDLFFVLSGYLIYGSLMARRQSFLPFMRRRITRIYPAFSVVFVIYLILSFLQPAASKIPYGKAEAALYILENYLLLPGIFPIEPLITVAWSLSYEMLYYLALPPLICVLALPARSRRWRTGFFMAAGLTMIALCAHFDGPIRLAMFVGGILLHEALKAEVKAPGPGVAVIMALAAFLSMTVVHEGATAIAVREIVSVFGFFCLCLHCFSQPQSWLARGFSVTPLRWLGNMSYSYYLLHGLTLKIIEMLLMKAASPIPANATFVIGALPVVFVLTLFLPAALFLYIERPFSLVKRRSAPAVPVQPSTELTG